MGLFPDRKESSEISLGIASDRGVSNFAGAIVIDSQPVPEGKYWTIELITANIFVSGANLPTTTSPIIGIFACPPGTPDPQPLGFGNNIPAAELDAVPIRLDGPSTVDTATASYPGALTLSSNSPLPIVLPARWFLRTHAVAGNNLTLGAASTGTMRWTYRQGSLCGQDIG